jgi:hypothetical protein
VEGARPENTTGELVFSDSDIVAPEGWAVNSYSSIGEPPSELGGSKFRTTDCDVGFEAVGAVRPVADASVINSFEAPE